MCTVEGTMPWTATIVVLGKKKAFIQLDKWFHATTYLHFPENMLVFTNKQPQWSSRRPNRDTFDRLVSVLVQDVISCEKEKLSMVLRSNFFSYLGQCFCWHSLFMPKSLLQFPLSLSLSPSLCHSHTLLTLISCTARNIFALFFNTYTRTLSLFHIHPRAHTLSCLRTEYFPMINMRGMSMS